MSKRFIFLLLLLPVIALSACATSSQAPAAGAEGTPHYAGLPVPTGPLPRTVVPKAYRLQLQVDPSQPEFAGTAEIDVQLQSPTSYVWLHGQHLQVGSAQMVLADGRAVGAQYKQVTEDGVVHLALAEEVPAGAATLKISYTAPFDPGLQGLYRVKDGDRWYAFSQMEAISARLCFPGFDEPSFKTPFEVSLVIPSSQAGFANSPEVAREPAQAGWQRLKFAPTKPLPTYLVALAVGELDVVEGTPIPPNAARSEPVPLRGLAVKGKGPNLAYALKYTGDILQSLETYFGIGYPFEKIDLVAVPDFAAGAMENPGLITFREWLLLLDESASVDQKRAFAYVMAHELAHQWFGNLVTMPWWDDIWLNESFASWLEFEAVGPWRPEFKAELSQAAEVMEVMDLDSLVAARRIREPINTSHDIHNAFDPITYTKGGGVLSMFKRYLGEDNFRKGVAHYLRKHSYGLGTYRDFLIALSEGSGQDVTASFESFLLQPGVPMLEVTPTCVDGAGSVAVRQQRYFPLGSAGAPAQTWKVPMCMKVGRGAKVSEQCTLLTAAAQTVELEGGCADWVLPNAEAAGYYRWSLPGEALAALQAKALPQLSPRDVMSLAESVHAGLRNGTLSVRQAAPVMQLLAAHPERAAAVRPMDWLRFARLYLVGDAQRDAVERFSRELYQPRYKALGLTAKEGETEDTRLLRRDVVSFLALVGRDPAVREALRQGFHAHVGYGAASKAPALDVNLLETAAIVAGEEASAELVTFLRDKLQAAADPTARRRLLLSMASVVEPAAAQQLRDIALSEHLRANEVFKLLAAHMAQPENRYSGWSWLTTNFDAVVKRVPPGHAGMLPHLAAGFCTAQDEKAVDAFFTGKVGALLGGPRNLAGTRETIQLCQAQVQAAGGEAAAFFNGAGAGKSQGASAPMP